MRKIHITESQLKELKRMLKETDIDLRAGLEKHPNDIKAAAQDEKRDNPALFSQDDNRFVIDTDAVEESCEEMGHKNPQFGVAESYTKKQIKEARLNAIKKNCTVYKKKDIKR